MFNWLNHQSSSIAGGATLVAIFSVFSRLAGFLRNALLAHQFGASDILDAYFAAFRLPDFLYQVIFVGALSAGFIPIFVERMTADEPRAWALAQAVLRWMLAAVGGLAIVFIILAPWIVPLIAPGFSGTTLERTITFSRIMFLQPVFLAASGVIGGVLQAQGRFFAYALAPIFYNLGIIFGILVLTPIFGPVGLAWGVVLGGGLHLLVQLAPARSLGFRVARTLRLASPQEVGDDLREILKLSLPRALAILVMLSNALIVLFFASRLEPGSVAILSFAQDLAGFPVGVFAMPLAVALFPALARLRAQGEGARFSATFFTALRQVSFVLVPLTFFFWVFREPLVRFTLEYGKFAIADTVLTAEVLAFLALAFVANGFLYLSHRAFFALADTKTPLLMSLLGFLSNVLFALLLTPRLGVAGLALSLSLAYMLQSTLLFGVLRPRLAPFAGSTFFMLAKVVCAAALAVLSGWGVLKLVPFSFLTLWGQALASLLLGGGVSAFVFFLLSWLFRIEEARAFISKVLKSLNIGQI